MIYLYVKMHVYVSRMGIYARASRGAFRYIPPWIYIYLYIHTYVRARSALKSHCERGVRVYLWAACCASVFRFFFLILSLFVRIIFV